MSMDGVAAQSWCARLGPFGATGRGFPLIVAVVAVLVNTLASHNHAAVVVCICARLLKNNSSKSQIKLENNLLSKIAI